jgi:hypothetical protein
LLIDKGAGRLKQNRASYLGARFDDGSVINELTVDRKLGNVGVAGCRATRGSGLVVVRGGGGIGTDDDHSRRRIQA